MADKEKKQKVKASVLFVCTGNTCRSPMAEFMFKQYLAERKRSGDFTVSSAGLYVERGDVLSENADGALTTLGIKHTPGRKARTFTVSMSLDTDLIIAMSARHAAECGGGDNVISFEDIGDRRPILDPFGGPLRVYLDCAAQIRSQFDAILELCDIRLAKKRAAAQ